MNIGLFTETYYPEINGVAASVYVLKEELEKLGHNVYVFTTTTPGAPKNEKNVYRVPSLPCFLISERRVGMFYQRKLAGIIKELNLDIIHTNTEFSLGVFGRIMAKELRIPIVHTYHTIYEDYTHYITKGKILDERAKKVVRAITRVCCNTVSEVIVPTKKVEELLRQYHVERGIHVIPSGINLDKFDPMKYNRHEIDALRKQYGIRKEDKVILYIGRASHEKNLDELLVYVNEYLQEHENAKFMLVGSGPDSKKIEEMVSEMEAKNSIILAGAKPYDQIGKYYQLGNVFVSASNSETQGLTFIEAMAAGLPVVAKEDSCLDGILEPGENGFFFQNVDDFKDGLDHILFGKYGLVEKDYPTNAWLTAQNYSTENFAKSVMELYEKVLMNKQVNFYD